jgi:hypothetical protein
MHGGSEQGVGMKMFASSLPVMTTNPAAAKQKICHFKPMALLRLSHLRGGAPLTEIPACRVVLRRCSCACAPCWLRCWLCYGLHWLCYGLHWLSGVFLKLEIGQIT